MAKGNPYGHEDSCACEGCQTWKDVQLGIAALAELKRTKAASAVPTTLPVACNCGQVLNGTEKFCPGCGKPTNFAKQCKSCGSKVSANARFCTLCGKPLS